MIEYCPTGRCLWSINRQVWFNNTYLFTLWGT